MDVAPGAGRVVGRYVLYDEIASGGMATVHLGRMIGQVGFARVVAVKRLHSHLARDPEFVAMFLDEARLAAGVRHPNVVATLDVVAMPGELFLVMEYVEGESLSHLIRATRRAGGFVPLPIVSSVICGMLYGLHAAHVASDERGAPLEIVHRDVSPQNILIGVDGVTRVADFGVAKAQRRLMETEAGRMKGKFSYMAPEQVRRDSIDRRADVFCAGICAWEALTGKHLFRADDPGRVIVKLLEMPIEPPSAIVPEVPAAVDAIVLRALDRNPDQRFQSAREMAMALEDALAPAIPRKVGEWVASHVGAALEQRHRRLAEMQVDSETRVELAQIAREVSAPSIPPPEPSAPLPSAADQPALTALPEAPGADRSDLAQTDSGATSDSEHRPQLAALAPPPSDRAPMPALDGAPPLYAPGAEHTPISQLSGVLSASYTEPPKLVTARRRLPWHVLLAFAAVGVVALGGLATLLTSSEEPRAESAAPPFAPSALPPVAGPSPPAAEPEVTPVASAPDAATGAEPEPEKRVATTATRKPAALGAPKPTARPAAPPVPKASCNPPYTIENGIKKFKRHCL
jgi:eukaryotic-like serine/threonine-protein kinase